MNLTYDKDGASIKQGADITLREQDQRDGAHETSETSLYLCSPCCCLQQWIPDKTAII